MLPILLAQAAPAPEVVSPYPELASISAIVAVTLIVTQVIKKLVWDVPALGKVPTWIYAVASAAVLVLVARFLLGTLDGDVGPLLWQAALAAGSASGFYTWLRGPGDTPADHEKSKTPRPSPFLSLLGLSLLAGAALGLTGCGVPNAFLVAAERHQQTVDPEYLLYVEADAGLTPDEKAIRRANVEAFGRAIEAERGTPASPAPGSSPLFPE